MKDYESDRSAGTRSKTFAAAAAGPKKALYAGHSALEQMHLRARFRTMNGTPLDANVPPLSMLPTAPDEVSTADSRMSAQTAAEPAMQPAPLRHEAARHEAAGGRPRTPLAANPGMRQAHAPEPLSAERESSSLHTMLIGSLITASVAIGLSSSLWLNRLDKPPRSQNEISLWEAPEAPSAGTAAASGSEPDDMKNGIKNAVGGIGQWLLTSFGLAPQAKQRLAANTPQEWTAPAAGSEKRSLLAPDGDAPVSLLPPDAAAGVDPLAAPLSGAGSAERPASASPPLPGVAPSLQEPSAPKKAIPAERTSAPAQTRTAARKKKPDEQQAAAYPSTRKKHLSRAKERPASKPRHASVAVARGERSDEIGRLKSQAFSETASDRIENKKAKRKTPLSDYIFLPQSSSEKESASTRNAKTVKVKQALSQCQHRSNFFRREYCKWQVCGGRWGKYGCPSFENKTASY